MSKSLLRFIWNRFIEGENWIAQQWTWSSYLRDIGYIEFKYGTWNQI